VNIAEGLSANQGQSPRPKLAETDPKSANGSKSEESNKEGSRSVEPAGQTWGMVECLAHSSGGSGRDAESGVQATRR
jgi:hypothetical protein